MSVQFNYLTPDSVAKRQKCPICLARFGKKKKIGPKDLMGHSYEGKDQDGRVTKLFHAYHTNCLKPHLERAQNCPTCRAPKALSLKEKAIIALQGARSMLRRQSYNLLAGVCMQTMLSLSRIAISDTNILDFEVSAEYAMDRAADLVVISSLMRIVLDTLNEIVQEPHSQSDTYAQLMVIPQYATATLLRMYVRLIGNLPRVTAELNGLGSMAVSGGIP
jgi:hypothetical protein